MTSRVSARTTALALNWIDLPVLDHPQHVNDDGLEILAPDSNDKNGEEEDEVGDAVDDEDVDMKDGAVEDGGQGAEEVVDATEGQPVLSVSESLVLLQSLNQTRQRHIQRLLPHIFSHPPISSHNRPRARAIPKSTFQYPTQSPPPLPLPFREYHGPKIDTKPQTASSPSPSSPLPGSSTLANTNDKDNKDDISKGKSKRQRKAAEWDDSVPAHEGECIARITLSIGPFQYPDTELWVGRFIEPKSELPKIVRVEKRDRKSSTPAGIKKPRISNSNAASGPITSSPLVNRPNTANTASTPLEPPYRPRLPPPHTIGPTSTPITRPAASRPPGQPAPSNPATAINPELINRVNAAASKHPWLSTIIHRAARSQATKDELAKLGRVVGKLSKGEEITEADNTPIPAPTPLLPISQPTASTSTSGIRPPAPVENVTRPVQNLAPPSLPNKASEGMSETSSVLSDLESDSDEEVRKDMKGPKQVGGGGPDGIEPTEDTEMDSSSFDKKPPDTFNISSSSSSAKASPKPPSSAFSPFVPNPVSAPPRSTFPQPTSIPISSTSTVTPIYRPMNTIIPQRPGPPSGSQPQNRPPMPYTPSVHPTSTTLPPTPPPPPPKPIYPKLAPFLYVAFKDAPTEKYLLPLGSNSYVTRIGGDHVPHFLPPPPLQPSVPPVDTSISSSTPSKPAPPVPEAHTTISEANIIPDSDGTRSRKTRASLGASKPKESVPPPPPKKKEVKKEPTPIPEPIVEEVVKKKERPRSGLDLLPGTQGRQGNVLISMIVPTKGWEEPDWKVIEEGIPWINGDLLKPFPSAPPPPPPSHSPSLSTTTQGLSNQDQPGTDRPTDKTSSADNQPQAKSSPSRPKRNLSKSSEIIKTIKREKKEILKKPALLNFGAWNFIPNNNDHDEKDSVKPVTIRLDGIDDKVWIRFKMVLKIIEDCEIAILARDEPELQEKVSIPDIGTPNPPPPLQASVFTGNPTTVSMPNITSPAIDSSIPTPSLSAPPAPPPPTPIPSNPQRSFNPAPKVLETYHNRKKQRFLDLLSRVSPRKFLRMRTEAVDPVLVEATSDKWALRPYPISTKALYTVSTPPPESEYPYPDPISLSPMDNKGKKGVQSDVTFEMPINLDNLDERVEEGAKYVVSKKRGGYRGRKSNAASTGEGEGGGGGGGGEKKARGRTDVLCEGCGLAGLKIWRKGPGGRGTLCKDCGELYVEGKLGELKAPGAASKRKKKVPSQKPEGDVEVMNEDIKLEKLDVETVEEEENPERSAPQPMSDPLEEVIQVEVGSKEIPLPSRQSDPDKEGLEDHTATNVGKPVSSGGEDISTEESHSHEPSIGGVKDDSKQIVELEDIVVD